MPVTFIPSAATEPKQLQFVEAYRKRFQKLDAAPSAAQSYDAVHLLALAMNQAGSTEGPAVQAALENLKAPYEGVTGSYDRPFQPGDHEGISPAQVVWGKVAAGAVVLDAPAK